MWTKFSNTRAMATMEEISKTDCRKLSILIRDGIYRPAYDFKTRIFLCGAALSEKDKMRYKIAKTINENWQLKNNYDILYPEDIFDEFLYGSKKTGLLSLENLLAESVDAIVLIPESPDSFSKLEAFVNNEKLRQKLVYIIDKKFKKDPSFLISRTPNSEKKANPSKILFVDPNSMEDEIKKINRLLKKMKGNSVSKNTKLSLLLLENFILACLYLLEPVSKGTLINLVAGASQNDLNAFQTTTLALQILHKKKLIALNSEGYCLTLSGIENFLAFRKIKNRIKRQEETSAFDTLRLEMMHFQNRKKKLRI